MKTKKILAIFLALVLFVASSALALACETEEGEKQESVVNSITLSSEEGGEVSWATDGHSHKGFKIVWSQTSAPTYPTRDTDKYQYLSSSDANSGTLDAFEGSGTYYVRVCEYLGGECGVYSNEIQVELEGKASETFYDVAKSHKNYEAIKYMKRNGFIKGYEGSKFLPKSRVNRAEFLKMAMEASDYEAGGSNCFNDVGEEWFAPYICKAKDEGIINGYGDGKFRPEREVNFAEASKIIVKIHGVSNNEGNNESWYHKYVVALEDLSAIPETINEFEKMLDRGEVAEIIWRIKVKKRDKASKNYMSLKAKKAEITVPSEVVNSISLLHAGEKEMAWTLDGYSKQGFKLVWSKTSNPTYPTRSTDKYQYFSNPETRSGNLSPFDGSGKYYVRVCEYLGGACDKYSNQVEVEL